MKKSIILPFLSAFLCFGVALTSCQKGADNIIQSSDRNIVSIALKEGTLPDVIVLGHFDEAGIKVVVTYSDGTNEEVAINSEFLGDEYANIIQTVGTHQVSLLYRGETINITIKIVPAAYEVCFYAKEGEKADYALIKTQTVGYQEPATAPDIQNEVWDDVKHYTFANWDVDFSSVIKRLDVYAQYTSVNYYTVNFYNGKEELIDSQKVDEGSNAVEPDEEKRHEQRYEFIGWDRSYQNITKNINVYGIYQRVTYANVHYDLTPEIEGNTIKYGLYPQSLVEDSALIASLEQTEEFENSYYVYDEQFYKKACVTETGKTFQGNEKYALNETYWFKVEPIKWNIVSQENGVYTLQTTKSIDVKQYNDSLNTTRVDNIQYTPNRYDSSYMRSFLNGEFFDDAFILNDSHLVRTIVDNSAASTAPGVSSNPFHCDDTNDYVWLQSGTFTPTTKEGITDYCQYQFDMYGDASRYAYEWCRSPLHYQDGKWVLYFIDEENTYSGCWATDYYGIRPMVAITL